MNRRSFLKMAGLAIVAPSVPVVASAQAKEIACIPNECIYGNLVLETHEVLEVLDDLRDIRYPTHKNPWAKYKEAWMSNCRIEGA